MKTVRRTSQFKYETTQKEPSQEGSFYSTTPQRLFSKTRILYIIYQNLCSIQEESCHDPQEKPIFHTLGQTNQSFKTHWRPAQLYSAFEMIQTALY